MTMALHRGGVYDRSQHLGSDGERPFLCCRVLWWVFWWFPRYLCFNPRNVDDDFIRDFQIFQMGNHSDGVKTSEMFFGFFQNFKEFGCPYVVPGSPSCGSYMLCCFVEGMIWEFWPIAMAAGSWCHSFCPGSSSKSGHEKKDQDGSSPLSMAISGTDWLEVPTIYKAYVREYPHKIWPYMVQYLHFRILKFPFTL